MRECTDARKRSELEGDEETGTRHQCTYLRVHFLLQR